MKLPCELTLWYILPRIRSELAKELMRMGLTQKEISDKLRVTQASVSYYLNKKRGAGIKFKKSVLREIKHLAKDITGNNCDNLNDRICKICKLVREDNTKIS